MRDQIGSLAAEAHAFHFEKQPLLSPGLAW
jgi:hypothetical protein